MKALLAFAFLFFAADAHAQQCVGGNCPPAITYYVPAQPAVAPPPRWFKSAEDDRLELWFDGKFLGYLDPETLQWQADGKKVATDLRKAFGLRQPVQKMKQVLQGPSCPAECDCGPVCDGQCPCCSENEKPIVNHGMNWKPNGHAVCKVNGVETSHSKMIEAITRGGSAADIPDDAGIPRLVVLSRDAGLRSRILKDFDSLATWKGKVIAQAYDPAGPEAWAVKDLYPREGIYYVDADGKPRGFSPDYSDGPKGMESALAQAQKLRDPNGVDPSKSPDLAKPKPSPAPSSPAPNSPSPSEPAGPAAGNSQPLKPIDWIIGGAAFAGLAGFAGAALAKRKKS